jgi:electron transport complex protein RnfG
MLFKKKNPLITKNIITLAVFTLFASCSVVFMEQLTRETIQKSKREFKEFRLTHWVSTDTYDNDILNDCLSRPLNIKKTQLINIYRMRKNNEPVALVFQVKALNGYSGVISLMLTFRVDGLLLGMNVIHHSETPGLGDKIESTKSNWSQQFSHIKLAERKKKDWNIKRYHGVFDGITGATITSQAVIKTIKNTQDYFMKKHERLFRERSYCQ